MRMVSCSPAHFDGVVGHQPMAAHDQVQRAFALADAALADDQHAQPEHVHQHGMDHRAFGERVFQNRRELRDGHRRRHGRLQQRQPGALRLQDEFNRGVEAAGDEHAGKVEREREPHRRDARRGFEALEIADLALAEYQDASRLEILVESGQREAGLLDVGTGDDALQAVFTRENVERQTERFRPAGEQRADGDAGAMRHGRLSDLCLHERQLAVRAPIEHADDRCLRVPEDDDAVAVGLELAGRHRRPTSV